MSNLHFGADIRIENLMLLEAMSEDDAEVIYDDVDNVQEALEDAGIVIPVEDIYDAWELREFFEESGFTGFFGFACTPVPEIDAWNYYARLPVYGKDIDEFKERAIEKVAAYRKKEIGKQGGEA